MTSIGNIQFYYDCTSCIRVCKTLHTKHYIYTCPCTYTALLVSVKLESSTSCMAKTNPPQRAAFSSCAYRSSQNLQQPFSEIVPFSLHRCDDRWGELNKIIFSHNYHLFMMYVYMCIHLQTFTPVSEQSRFAFSKSLWNTSN